MIMFSNAVMSGGCVKMLHQYCKLRVEKKKRKCPSMQSNATLIRLTRRKRLEKMSTSLTLSIRVRVCVCVHVCNPGIMSNVDPASHPALVQQ